MNLMKNEANDGHLANSDDVVSSQTFSDVNGTSLSTDKYAAQRHSTYIKNEMANDTDIINDGRFTCRRCGNAEYRNGEFTTIKLGDLFTSITPFSNSATSTSTSGSEDLCTQCQKYVNDTESGSESRSHNHRNTNGGVTGPTPDPQKYSNNEDIKYGLSSIANSYITDNNRFQNSSSSSSSVIEISPNTSHLMSVVAHSQSSEYFNGSPLTNINTESGFGPILHDNNNEAINQLFSIGDNSTSTIPNHVYFTNQLSVLSSDPTHNGASGLDPKIIVQNVQTQIPQGHGHSVINCNGSVSGQYPTPSPNIGSPTPTPQNLSQVPISALPRSTSVSTKKSKNKVVVVGGNKTTLVGGALGSEGDPPRIPCTLCKKTFKNPKMASLHVKRVHEKTTKFVCEICKTAFTYRENLDSHLASHHKPTEKTHDCPTCGQKFKEKSNLSKHIRYHTDNPKKFLCEHCPSGFSKRVNLRYHIRRKHPEVAMNNNSITSASPMAPGYFPPSNPIKSPGNVITDLNIASPPTTVSTVSGGSGKTNGKDKPQGSFKCDQCGRGFLFKNNLKAHLRTHTRDKKYVCELCQKSFIYKESLKNHMLLHSNELPYNCDICGKKFRDRSNRRKHVKNVHKYLFANGEVTPGAGPSLATSSTVGGGAEGSQSSSKSVQGGVVTGEIASKKRKRNSKKSNTQNSEELAPQSVKTPRKRSKKNNTSESNPSSLNPSSISAKSVIVSNMMDTLDREIIMSPSPRTRTSPPIQMDYGIQSPHPVSVQMPMAGPGQFSHLGSEMMSNSRNIIVKASSTISSSPNDSSSMTGMGLYGSQDDLHSPIPMQMQNVIVYPKPKLTPDHLQHHDQHHHSVQMQQYSSSDPMSGSSVISQINQNIHSQQHTQSQQQYYSVDPNDRNLRGYDKSPAAGSYLSVMQSQSMESLHHTQTLNLSPVGSGGANTAGSYQYNILSTNASSGPQPQEAKLFTTSSISHTNSSQYSQIYSDPYHTQPHHYWPGHSNHPSEPNSPYEVDVGVGASSVAGGDNRPTPTSMGVVPSSYGESHSVTSNVHNLNAPSYGQPQAGEPIDPSTHGSTFLYKDLSQFDFSYL